MVLGLKKDKGMWGMMIGLLFAVIAILILILFSMMNDNQKKNDAISDNVQVGVADALNNNLSFYNSDISYEIKKEYSISGKYAVVLLDVAGVTYRALLEYIDGEWRVLSYPRIVLSYVDFPEVPAEILKAANEVGR